MSRYSIPGSLSPRNTVPASLLTLVLPLFFGLLPLLMLERSLGLLHNLTLLLTLLYLVLFLSLGVLALATRFMAKKMALRPLPAWLRLAVLVEAAILSGLWYKFLNPFPMDLLLATGQRALAGAIVTVLILAWLMFLFLIRKLLLPPGAGRI